MNELSIDVDELETSTGADQLAPAAVAGARAIERTTSDATEAARRTST
jgi:hypothetical protein